MKLSLCLFALLILAAPLEAQTATVSYDIVQPGVTAAIANQWTAVLYVNATCAPAVPCVGGTAFPSAHVCVAGVGTAVSCSFVIPTASYLAALTASGPQNFSVAVKDAVLGTESPETGPFIRIRPIAPTNPRGQ